MGWSSATGLFDGTVDAFIRLGSDEDTRVQIFVEYLYTVVYADSDWDTQDESKYFEEYLKQIMLANGEIDDDY